MWVLDWWPIIAFAISVLVWIMRAEARSLNNTVKADDAMTRAEEAKEAAQEAKDALGKFETIVAREYVTVQMVKDIENRIMDQFDRLFGLMKQGR